MTPRLCILLLFSCVILTEALRNSFILSFNENDEISTEEWAIFKGEASKKIKS